jgi:hypothetical protein
MATPPAPGIDVNVALLSIAWRINTRFSAAWSPTELGLGTLSVTSSS